MLDFEYITKHGLLSCVCGTLCVDIHLHMSDGGDVGMYMSCGYLNVDILSI